MRYRITAKWLLKHFPIRYQTTVIWLLNWSRQRLNITTKHLTATDIISEQLQMEIESITEKQKDIVPMLPTEMATEKSTNNAPML